MLSISRRGYPCDPTKRLGEIRFSPCSCRRMTCTRSQMTRARPPKPAMRPCPFKPRDGPLTARVESLLSHSLVSPKLAVTGGLMAAAAQVRDSGDTQTIRVVPGDNLE